MAVITAIVAGHAGSAAAHPAIDRGIARYEEADFRGALEALQQAEGSGPLSRNDLLRLLATRALVQFALGRSEPMQHALTMLASLAPDYELGARAPPAVRKAFDRLAEQLAGLLAIDVAVETMPGGVRLRAVPRRDAAGAIEHVELAARIEDGTWQRTRSGSLVLPTRRGGVVQYYARAVGPGGAPLATDGTAEHPQRVRLREQGSGSPAAGTAVQLEASDPGRDGEPPWLWIGVGTAAAAIVGAVVLAIVLSGSDGDQDAVLMPPMLGGNG